MTPDQLHDHAEQAAEALTSINPRAFVVIYNDGQKVCMHMGGSIEDIAYLSACMQGQVFSRLTGQQTVDRDLSVQQ